jgi:hypothetical protein
MLSRSRLYDALEVSVSLSVLVPTRIIFDVKAAKEGGRLEMKRRTRWREEVVEIVEKRANIMRAPFFLFLRTHQLYETNQAIDITCKVP